VIRSTFLAEWKICLATGTLVRKYKYTHVQMLQYLCRLHYFLFKATNIADYETIYQYVFRIKLNQASLPFFQIFTLLKHVKFNLLGGGGGWEENTKLCVHILIIYFESTWTKADRPKLLPLFVFIFLINSVPHYNFDTSGTRRSTGVNF
jgi:hypothetical protein